MRSVVLSLKARYLGKERHSNFNLVGERPDTNRPPTRMEDLFWTHEGPLVDKWLHYLPLYERYVAPWRDRPVRLLEIGVFKGGSLKLWRDFLGPQAVIYGIDINPECAALDGLHGQVRIGSQTDAAFLLQVVKEMGGVDIVLDDGSHVSQHMHASLDVLYPLLPDGGLYIVEDTHACYWNAYGGGYRRKGSFLETVKTMIDDMHHWYHTQGERVLATAGHLGALHVHDSVVVLEKAAVKSPRRTQRGGL